MLYVEYFLAYDAAIWQLTACKGVHGADVSTDSGLIQVGPFGRAACSAWSGVETAESPECCTASVNVAVTSFPVDLYVGQSTIGLPHRE
jgi:hypothetical protein